MDTRVKIGDRLVAVGCSDRCLPLIYKAFVTLLRKRTVKQLLKELMDEYNIPKYVVVNFKEGKGDLYGQYFIYDESVTKHMIIIDVYTKPFERAMDDPTYDLQLDLLDTIVHELIHHEVASERETKKRTKAFMNKATKRL